MLYWNLYITNGQKNKEKSREKFLPRRNSTWNLSWEAHSSKTWFTAGLWARSIKSTSLWYKIVQMKKRPHSSDEIPQSIIGLLILLLMLYVQQGLRSHPMSVLFMGICTTQFISAFGSTNHNAAWQKRLVQGSISRNNRLAAVKRREIIGLDLNRGMIRMCPLLAWRVRKERKRTGACTGRMHPYIRESCILDILDRSYVGTADQHRYAIFE